MKTKGDNYMTTEEKRSILGNIGWIIKNILLTNKKSKDKSKRKK